MKVQLNTLFPLTEKYQQKKLLEYFDTMGQVEKAGNVHLEHFKQKESMSIYAADFKQIVSILD